MSEQPADPAGDPSAAREQAPRPTDVEATGVASVDDVLADLAQVQERPLEEHPAAFEAAHDRLRQALDDAGSA
ncbi:hypothetical protein [Nocardioides nanhaiensis]|uniref:Uncharacterized protein n=1 Tax=Nocardioides nanhaiensis TaxID=1476871 RepID=A0ABP8WPH8_9ACTN